MYRRCSGPAPAWDRQSMRQLSYISSCPVNLARSVLSSAANWTSAVEIVKALGDRALI
jgi:hypothetical protein